MPAVTKTPNVCNVNGTGPTEICINEHTVIIATNTAIRTYHEQLKISYYSFFIKGIN